MTRLASDAHLVTLVRQGWPVAFETVYARYHRPILSFSRHMLGDADDAEDVVQHTFLAAYNDLISSDKPIQLRAWLFTIARNRCYSVLRARREQPRAELSEPITEGLATQVQRRQDLRDLVGDLQGLPEEQRAALVLAELDALSHAQIAEVLGVPSKKVKALVFQARESLLASRTARDTACVEIREQLANGHGAMLRRSHLRRHLRECQGCRDYRREVERQRSRFALVLPVVPTLALKDAILGATVGAGAATGIATGGFAVSSVFKSALVKGLFGLILAGAGAGTYVAAHDLSFVGHGSLLGRYPAVRMRTEHAAVAHRAAAAATAAHSTGSSTAGLLHSLTAAGALHSSRWTLKAVSPVIGHLHGAGGSRSHRGSRAAGGAAQRRSGSHGSHQVVGAAGRHSAAPALATNSNAPYLGSSAYGSGAQTSSGGSRGGATGAGASGAGASAHVVGAGGGSAGSSSSGSSGGSRGNAGGGGSSSSGSSGGSNSGASGSGGGSSPTGGVRGGGGGGGGSSPSSSHVVSSTPPSTPAQPSSGGGGGGGTRGSSGGGGPSPAGGGQGSAGGGPSPAGGGQGSGGGGQGAGGGSNGGIR
jgi:RNA polymerase sigma factor (sigma-70 family)